ncbi:hypothetical protein [Dietzia sp. 179-F 9C3 NHS]|uniref:hypothetical protein n=1 Tax=Dietzia sp. 179-F 9C3 NHS TaxID=3374295 RepID=UPI003879C474
MSAIKKKAFAVSALTLGGIAGATGTAYAAQGGVSTELPDKARASATESPRGGGQGGVATETPSTPARKAAKPAPTIAQAEQPRATNATASGPAQTPRATSGGGQGGITTEVPSDRKSERSTTPTKSATAPERPSSAPATASTPQSPATTTGTTGGATARQASNVTPTQQTQTTAAQTNTTTGGATARQASNVTPTQQTQTTAAQAQQNVSGQQGATQETKQYADTTTAAETDAGAGEAAATGADDAAPSGQGGVLTEMPGAEPDQAEADTAGGAGGDAPADAVDSDEVADDAAGDYTKRVEAASQTPTSGSFDAASPADPNGVVSTYVETRQADTGGTSGVEVGAATPNVSTGTAVEYSGTSSHVSNTTVGGGEQATAAQTWDVSNGNYNATWSTSGGVSGTGGFSATNTQTAPNVGTAAVDGQWSSPAGGVTATVTGGANLHSFGVHDATGSVDVQTPFGSMQFQF